MNSQFLREFGWRWRPPLLACLVAGASLMATACAERDLWIATAPQSNIILSEYRPLPIRFENGCSYLVTPDDKHTLIWPFGFRWDASAKAVVGPDGEQFFSGEHVVVTGGEGSIAGFQPKALREHLKQCGAPFTIANFIKKGDSI